VTYLFHTDTTANHLRDTGNQQHWQTTLGEGWSIGDKPNGGYVLGSVAKVIAGAITHAERDSTHVHPLTITGHYLRPSEPGPADVAVEIVRVGRTFTTARAVLTQGGKDRLHVLATFGNVGDQRGPTRQSATPPELPPIEQCPSRDESDGFPNGSTMGTNVSVRLHPETGWLHGKRTDIGETRAWVSFADECPIDPYALVFFTDALPPTVFELLPERSWVPTIELTVQVRALPAPGPLRAVMRTRHMIDGRFEEDGELWDSTGCLVALSRQLGMVLS
jgi:acyl-CoA thioesterase